MHDKNKARNEDYACTSVSFIMIMYSRVNFMVEKSLPTR